MSRIIWDYIIEYCILGSLDSFLFYTVTQASRSIVAGLWAAELWILCPTCFYRWQLLPNSACCWRIPPTATAVWLFLWPTSIRSAIHILFQPQNEKPWDPRWNGMIRLFWFCKCQRLWVCLFSLAFVNDDEGNKAQSSPLLNI